MDEEHISELKEEEKNEQATKQNGERDAARREDRRSSQWIFGLILICVGLFFLLGTVFPFNFLANWWALFILLPAAYNLNRAYQSYRHHGHLTDGARGNLIGGLLIGTVGLIFLFGLNWGVVWPVFIIIVGIGALLRARSDE